MKPLTQLMEDVPELRFATNRAVFIVHSEAFEYDEEIGATILKEGFQIREQGLFDLNAHRARLYAERMYMDKKTPYKRDYPFSDK